MFRHPFLICTTTRKVLRLYESKVLDSIQFLFDLGFVPRVTLPAAYTRAAVVEAVRLQMDISGGGGGVVGKDVPLALEAWSRDAAGAAATGGVVQGDGPKKKGEDAGRVGGIPALGARILSTSR